MDAFNRRKMQTLTKVICSLKIAIDSFSGEILKKKNNLREQHFWVKIKIKNFWVCCISMLYAVHILCLLNLKYNCLLSLFFQFSIFVNANHMKPYKIFVIAQLRYQEVHVATAGE